MPRLSAFTRCGHLRMSSTPSHGETIYGVLYDQLSRAFDLTQGTHAEALVYAMAMLLARARYTLERAGNQQHPKTAYDLLPLLEKDYLLTPGPNDTVPQRAAAVLARMMLSRGAVTENIKAGLRAILGSEFLGYRPFPVSEAFTYPTTWTAAGTKKANPTRTSAPPKLVTLTGPVTATGIAFTVGYTNLDPTAAEVQLVAGDVVMAQPENTGLSERVIITSAAGTGTARTLTATFTNAHDSGAILTTQSWPYWWSTKRRSLIAVSAAASVDPEKRRRVDEFMARVARGVSQWAIVDATSHPGDLGPYSINLSPLGATPLEHIYFTPDP